MLDEIDSGLTYENSQVEVAKFLDEWLVSVESSVRYSTFKQYSQVVKQHILPRLGKYALRDLKPGQIQHLYNSLISIGKSLRTVQLVHSVLHRALVHAVKLGIIPRNPDDATVPPRPKSKEMKSFDENQAQQFLIAARAKKDRFYPLYYLAISTGMRQAELLGLKWEDLDWDLGTLQVQRQLTRKKGGGFEFTAPKTKSGVRQVDLGSATLKVLREHRQALFEQHHSMGDEWQDKDMMFPSQVGTPMDRDNLRRQFKTLLREAGLPEIRFHDLRHTAASLMLNNGLPVIIVSRRLGHAKPSITLDVYGHLIPAKQQEAAILMDQLLTPIQIDLKK